MLLKMHDNRLLSLHARIMACSRGRDNDDTFACILATWQAGESVLPDWLGLGPEQFFRMLAFHFPGFPADSLPGFGREPATHRYDEQDELRKLLLAHRTGVSESEIWMAEVVAVASMGLDHLWQDMGLWSRKDLGELMMKNFPTLANQNNRDMKWKKFLYKQLCVTEGVYTCRSPSCERCTDYEQCFGQEE